MIMKKSLGLISLLSLSAGLIAAPAHLTFFGDSLTDTGNFPEPANVSDATLKNFNIYVPITNPVIVPTSDPMNTFLAESEGGLGDQGKINNETRSQYSINWPLYLTYALTKLAPKPLTPWFRYAMGEAIDTDNINYAWASAVAGNPSGDPEANGECFHSGGEAYYGDCNQATLLSDRKAYQTETAADSHFDKKHNYEAMVLQIPDLNKQVAFFLDDFGASLPKDNAIFIYIGGNDISHFLKPLLLDMALENEDDFMAKRVAPQMHIVASYVQQAVVSIKAAYGTQTDYHIYIMSLPHLSNLHEAYSYAHIPVFGELFGNKLISILDKTVDLYNADLQALFPKDPQVTFVDSGGQMNGWASSGTYNQAIAAGKACSQNAAYLTASAVGTTDCQTDGAGGTTGDFSWNDAHFTAPVNHLLAEYMQGMLQS
jgi:hypothetical protein